MPKCDNLTANQRKESVYHQTMKQKFSILPDEIILLILEYLDTKTLCLKFALSNSHCYKIAMQESLWKLRCLNQFQYPEFKVQQTNNSTWKQVYKKLSKSLSATYLIRGHYSNGLNAGLKYNYTLYITQNDLMLTGIAKNTTPCSIFGFKRGLRAYWSHVWDRSMHTRSCKL